MKISEEQLKKIIREEVQNDKELQEIFGLGSSDDPTSIAGRFGQWRQQRKDVKAGKAAAKLAGKEAAINKKQYDAAAQKAIKIDKLMQPFKAKFEKVKQDYENDDLEMPQVDKALKAMQARLDGFFNAMKSYNLTPQQPAASAGEPQLQAANAATTNENFSRKYKFGPKAQVKIAQLEEAMQVYENERLQEDVRANTQRQAKYLNILNTVGQQMNRYINFFNTAVKPALDKRPEQFNKKAKAAPAAEPAMQAAAASAQPETPATPAAVPSDSAQTATQGPGSATTDATAPAASGEKNTTTAPGEATTSATAAPAGETETPASGGTETAPATAGGTETPAAGGTETAPATAGEKITGPGAAAPSVAAASGAPLKQQYNALAPPAPETERSRNEKKLANMKKTLEQQPNNKTLKRDIESLEKQLRGPPTPTFGADALKQTESKKPVSYNKLYENWRRFTKG